MKRFSKKSSTDESLNGVKSEIDILDELMNVDLSGKVTGENEEEPKLPKYMIMESDRMAWDISLSVVIIFYTMVVPLRLAFEGTVIKPYATDNEYDFIATPAFGFWFGFDTVMDVIFLSDICLNFRTAYEINGFVVKDYKRIGKEYLTSWFLLDFMASFPLGTIFTLVGSGGSFGKVNKLVRILRFAKVSKILRVLKMGRIFRRVQMYAGLNPGVLRLGRSCIILILLWHYIACIYWMISRMEGFCDWGKPGGIYDPERFDDGYWADVDDDMSMQEREDYWTWGSTSENPSGFNECTGDWVPWRYTKRQTLQTQYSQAVFWSVMITTGVGYDIAPETNLEVFFTILCILIGILMNAVVIGSITSAIESFDAAQAEKREKLESVNEFLRKNNIPLRLRFEINDYYEYLFDAGLDAAAMVKELPVILQMKLEVALKKRKVLACSLFDGSKAEVLLILIQNLESEVKLPTEYLFKTGSDVRTMYIVENGQVNLLMEKLSPTEKWRMFCERLLERNDEESGQSLGTIFSKKLDPWSSSVNPRVVKPVEILVETIKKFGYFGEAAILGMSQKVSAKTQNYCELLYLDCNPNKNADMPNPLSTVAIEYPEFYRSIHKAIKTRIAKWETTMAEACGNSGTNKLIENGKKNDSQGYESIPPQEVGSDAGIEMTDIDNPENELKEEFDSDPSDSEMSTGSEDSDHRYGSASDWFHR